MFKQLGWRKKGWKMVLMGLLIFGLLTLSGCGALERLTGKDDPEAGKIGGWIGEKPMESASIPTTTPPTETITIELYFPDQSGQYLVKEERSIPKTLSIARESVNQWLRGPIGQGEAATAVISSTVLLDIGIKEGLATVDLSREFLEPLDKINPKTRLYGLVNTIAQFPSVKQVRLRIEGQNIANYAGIDVSNLTFNQDMVKGVLASGVTTYEAGTSQNQQKSSPAVTDSPSKIDLFSFPSNTI